MYRERKREAVEKGNKKRGLKMKKDSFKEMLWPPAIPSFKLCMCLSVSISTTTSTFSLSLLFNSWIFTSYTHPNIILSI